MISVIVQMPDGSWRSDIPHHQISELIQQPDLILWVDMQDPTPDEYKILQEEFAFHPLAIEDVVQHHHLPKIEIFGHYYFIVIYAMECVHPQLGVTMHELELFAGQNYVVTIHEHEQQDVRATLDQWQRNAEHMGSDVGGLVYTLLDRLVDGYFPIIDLFADYVEELEERIFADFSREALADIFRLKKELLKMRRVVAPTREIINVMLRRDPPIFPPESTPYIQDIYDHTIRVHDTLDLYRDLLSGATDAFLSVQGNRMNEIMYRLALISTIFLPLTFLTGFFGMNFETIPFASPWLLVVGLVLMVGTPFVFYWYFRQHYRP